MSRESFGNDWQFLLWDAPEDHWPKTGDGPWRTLRLPHDWSIEMERDPASRTGAHGGFFRGGTGLYRKTFRAPESWNGQCVSVEFEGVYMNAEVWLNAHFLGRHPYGYTSFAFDITPCLRPGADNMIRVKVDASGMKNSRWYSGAGIYRPVWLSVKDPVHVGLWGLRAETKGIGQDAALVHLVATVENAGNAARPVTVRWRVLDRGGAEAAAASSSCTVPAGGSAELCGDAKVPRPRLWSLETPYLYRLAVDVLADGTEVDREETSFGIRSAAFSASEGFRLNGEPLKLKGGCVHHDDGVLGACAYPRAEERKVELLKAAGYNAVRCAHNPPSPSFLDACDRLGMLVIDEAFDCWREGKNPHDYHVVFDDWWRRDLDSMVLRDRNHPSVVLWSIGNEVPEREGRSGAVRTARMLADRIRELDPGRPVTSALCESWEGLDWELTDAVFAELDVCGYNYQWRRYREDHGRHPRRVMAGTESFPIEAFENWQEVLANPHVVGDFVWTSLDYLGEAGLGRVHFDGEKAPFLGSWPWHQAYCGDMDVCGFKRPQSFYRDVLWGVGSPVHLFVHTPAPQGKTPTLARWAWPDVQPRWTWPGMEGRTMRVDVYTALESAELFLDGRSFGRKPAGKECRNCASFEVPYRPGRLSAVASGGGRTAEAVLETAGDPAAIRLEADRTEIRRGADDLSYLTVSIVDGEGRPCPHADRDVLFSIRGAGVLAAVGSGDPVSPEPYRGNRRRTFRGRCLAVVLSAAEPGDIRLAAMADGLPPAEAALRSV